MKRRQGFTLVELLVSIALIIFIMAILSGAFVAATNTFRNLKAAGDMAEKLRATTQILQRDLAADHFEGKRRLSNPNFWVNGPPQQGFFQIRQLSNGTAESTTGDIDGINSYLSTDHTLAFTIKLRGNQMGDFMTAGAPLLAANTSFGPLESRYQAPIGGTTYNYQWAEVVWFLLPQINPTTGQPDTTAPDQAAQVQSANLLGNPIPLWTLYRRQRLAVVDNSLVPALPITNQYQMLEVSCWPMAPPSTNLYFNSPIDLTVPQRRFGASTPLITNTPTIYPTNYTTLGPRQPTVPIGDLAACTATAVPPAAAVALGPTLNGADIQLTDVVSFDVRMLVSQVTATGLMSQIQVVGSADPFVTLFSMTPSVNPTTSVFLAYNNNNPLFNPLVIGNARVFDTWSSVNDGFSNFSQWNVSGTATAPSATAIPMWNGTSGPIIQAIQISIRIWDAKTNQTRQVTMVQAM
jgi:type II secretory pathway pseudopilin PulG